MAEGRGESIEHNITENTGDINDGSQPGYAALADGERIEQTFENCNVNVVAGDLIQVTQRDTNQPPRRENEGNRDPAWWNDAQRKIKEKYVAGFIKKLNAYTWKHVQRCPVEEDYEDLSQLEDEFYPQMKIGFDLYRGDYIPQEGVSAQTQTNFGEIMRFQECVRRIQRNEGKWCTIIGPPGSGKTVMMKRLAKELLLKAKDHNEIWKTIWNRIRFFCKRNRNMAHVILYMNIRDIPNLDSATPAQVMFSPAVITGLTKKEAQYGLQAIVEKKIGMYLILDGLDQATWQPESTTSVGHWTTANTATIFGNILNGHLLSDVPITISSREHSVAFLPREMRPEFILALVGFSESDAKAIYCQVMGDAEGNDWEEMRMLNPGIMYMCLTPLFLIFYMITRKRDPDDPPNCASEVMIRIIQICLQSDHMRNITDVAKVINKLKLMAFQGTEEQRVVFTNDDLDKFNVLYKEISDVIIQVSGQNILGQNIFRGMYRYFFSHQTLQEILSALCAVEKKLDDFKELVSAEFHKSYWSVVRKFSCGILKNERVRNKIDNQIFEQSEMEAKWQYLLETMIRQLDANPSPAEKLDIFESLKEANALEILRSYANDLDFSNSPLTSSMIYILSSVMKQFQNVPSLSLKYCGLDDYLLEAFWTSTKGLGIEIGNFDVSGNTQWTNADHWSQIFQNVKIANCILEIPQNEEDVNDIALILDIVDAANRYGTNLNFKKLNKIYCRIEQLEKLVESQIPEEIAELWMKSDLLTFDENTWQQTFQRMTFTVDRCFIEPPFVPESACPEERGQNVNIWIKAANASNVDSANQVSMKSRDDILVNINDIISLNHSGLHTEISKLQMKLDPRDIHEWRQTFQQMSFTVDHCIIESHRSSEAEVLIQAARAADVDNIKSISLKARDDVKVNTSDFVVLNKPKFEGEIRKLKRVYGEQLTAEDWKQTGILIRKFKANRSKYPRYANLPDLSSIAEGHGNIQFQRIEFWRFDDVYIKLLDSNSHNQNKLVSVGIPIQRLSEKPRDVGCIIKNCRVADVILNGTVPPSSIDVPSLVSGLNGFKIKLLAASRDFSDDTLLEIVDHCKVANLYLYDRRNDSIRLQFMNHTAVTILSKREWIRRFSMTEV